MKRYIPLSEVMGEYSVDPRAAEGDPSAEIFRTPTVDPFKQAPSEGGGEYGVSIYDQEGNVIGEKIYKFPPTPTRDKRK